VRVFSNLLIDLRLMNPLRLLLGLLLTVAAVQECPAQWSQIGPSGFLTCILRTPAGLFVGTSGRGVYFSSDNGTTWQFASGGLSNLAVSDLAAIGQTVFASTRGGGVFFSTNNGNNWTAVNQYLISLDIGSLAVVGSQLFAGPVGFGAFYSSDGGGTWLPAGKGMGTDTVEVFFSHAGNILAGSTRGVFRSSDGGKNWSGINAGLPPDCTVASFAATDNKLFVAVRRAGVFVSADEGTTWAPTNAGAPLEGITSLAVVPPSQGAASPVVAGTATEGLFISSDEGMSWSAVPLSRSSGIVDALIADSLGICAACGEGIRVSTDRGTVWSDAGMYMPTDLVTVLQRIGPLLCAGTRWNGVATSDDSGISWRSFNQQLSNLEVTSMAAGPTVFLAGTSGGSVFSRDTAASGWTAGGSALAGLPINAIGLAGGTFLAGPGTRGIYYSTDFGANWIAGQGSVVSPRGTQFDAIAAGTGYVFGGSSGSGVFRSTDNGRTWAQTISGLGDLTVHALLSSGSVVCAGTSAGVYRSTNNGSNWELSGAPFAGTPVRSLSSWGTYLFAGTEGEGVLVSSDQGATWRGSVDRLPEGTVTSTLCNGAFVYAATSTGGIRRRSLPEVLATLSTVGSPDGLPKRIDLEQNYPNPFNPVTTIGGELPAAGIVRLVVYDVLGRAVATVANGTLPAGRFSYLFDAQNLATGVYFYRMTVGTSSVTRTMVLLR
jgi:hypothetical protein